MSDQHQKSLMENPRVVDPEYEVAIAWLSDIQEKIYGALNIDPEEYNGDNVISDDTQDYLKNLQKELKLSSEYMDNFYDELVKMREAVPTKFENPAWYAVLTDFAGSIEKALAAQLERSQIKPLFGTVPTGRVNGFAARVPNTRYRVILLEDGLFGFANLMCKAIAMAFPEKPGEQGGRVSVSTDRREIETVLRTNKEIPARFFDALASYLVEGHPNMAEPYTAPRTAMITADCLRNSMEAFVVAHEYGHLVAGHLDDAADQRKAVADLDVDAISTNHRQEFEADFIGLHAMLSVMNERGYDLSLSFWGADAFFGCIDVVEKAVSVLAYGEERPWAADTHPPTPERRAFLRAYIAENAKDDAKTNCEAALQLASHVEFIIDSLWSMIHPALVAMHKDGFRPTPGWMAVS